MDPADGWLAPLLWDRRVAYQAVTTQAQDEVKESGDSPDDYADVWPDPFMGPGNSCSKSFVVNILTGNGNYNAVIGDQASYTGLDEPLYGDVFLGPGDLPIGGTTGLPRGRSRCVDNPIGTSANGSGHRLPPPAPMNRWDIVEQVLKDLTGVHRSRIPPLLPFWSPTSRGRQSARRRISGGSHKSGLAGIDSLMEYKRLHGKRAHLLP